MSNQQKSGTEGSQGSVSPGQQQGQQGNQFGQHVGQQPPSDSGAAQQGQNIGSQKNNGKKGGQ